MRIERAVANSREKFFRGTRGPSRKGHEGKVPASKRWK